MGLANQLYKQRRFIKVNNNSLAHSKWNCKYHIVFVPKYRSRVIYGKVKADVGVILRKLCEYKEVGIAEANEVGEQIITLKLTLV